MSTANGTNNVGHGHVYLRPDGVRMRCGGATMCTECAADHARKVPEIQAANSLVHRNSRRYEWLRSNSDPGADVVRCVTLDQQTEPVETRLCFGDDLDAKIDAEMAAAGAK